MSLLNAYRKMVGDHHTLTTGLELPAQTAMRNQLQVGQQGQLYLGHMTPMLRLDFVIHQLRAAEQAVEAAREGIRKWEEEIASSEKAIKLLFDNLTPEEQAILVEEKLKEEQ